MVDVQGSERRGPCVVWGGPVHPCADESMWSVCLSVYILLRAHVACIRIYISRTHHTLAFHFLISLACAGEVASRALSSTCIVHVHVKQKRSAPALCMLSLSLTLPPSLPLPYSLPLPLPLLFFTYTRSLFRARARSPPPPTLSLERNWASRVLGHNLSVHGANDLFEYDRTPPLDKTPTRPACLCLGYSLGCIGLLCIRAQRPGK